MLTNLVEKHGVVPKALFPEAEAGENSRRLERLTNNRVCSVNPKCANRNKSHLLFSSAEMFKKPLMQTVWTQIRAICSGSTLFAPILISSEMLGNYLQQTTSADNIF